VRYFRPVSNREALASLHRYAQWTLLGTVPVFAGAAVLATVSERPDERVLGALIAGAVMLVGVHLRRLARAIADPTADPAVVWPWRRSVATLVPATALMVLAAASHVEGSAAMWAFLPAMSVIELRFGRPGATAWHSVPAALGVGVVAGLVRFWSNPQEAVLSAVGVALIVLCLQFAETTALRQWRLTVELDQARRDAAELGATRERLRVAEDLHDILGHALEVVSLKSELATRLTTADPARAHAEMAEVGRLARGALTDVRALVQGHRSTHLDTELAGARGLLGSAGIDCAFDVPAHTLDEQRGELLGRVLREAVTNLLRHADTHHCWVTLRTDGDAATLRIVNDGVLETADDRAGTGLRALARRVGEAGGRFRSGPEEPGRFEVEVVLP